EAKRTQERRRRAGQGETHAVLPKRRAALEERRPNQLGRARLADARLEAPEDVLPVVGGVRVLELGDEVVPAVEVETDGRRVERSVVLELDPVAEVERPDSASSCAFPDGRAGRHGEGRSGREVDEAVEDLVDDTDGGRILDQRSVENHRVSLDTDGKRPAGSGASLLVYPGAGARPKRAEYGNCGERDDDPGTVSTHRSEEHTSELQSRGHLVCRLLLEKVKSRLLKPRIFPYTTLFRSVASSTSAPSRTTGSPSTPTVSVPLAAALLSWFTRAPALDPSAPNMATAASAMTTLVLAVRISEAPSSQVSGKYEPARLGVQRASSAQARCALTFRSP